MVTSLMRLSIAALVSALTLASVASGRGSVSATSSQPQTPQAAPPSMAAPDSCITCHRALVQRAVTHAASDYCASCHEQAAENRHQFKPVAQGAALCSTCHDIPQTSDTFVHGPVAVGDCLACHDPHGSAKPKLLSVSGAALCESCHTEITAKLADKRFQHKPVTQECISCHDPHGSPNRYQLKRTGAALCTSCHTDLGRRIAEAPNKHGAMTAERSCLNCHEAHASDVKPQLRSATMPLCLACHDKEQTLPDGRHVQNIKAALQASSDLHGPIREKDCVGCHRPHESTHFRLLREEYPQTFYSPFDPGQYALCFMCHQPDLVRVERTTTLTRFRSGDRNLHFVHVNRPDRGRTCRACHEAHGSNARSHIRDTVPFGRWSLPINYATSDDGQGGQCAPGCHVPRSYTRSIASGQRQP